jgi:hypothetical protein
MRAIAAHAMRQRSRSLTHSASANFGFGVSGWHLVANDDTFSIEMIFGREKYADRKGDRDPSPSTTLRVGIKDYGGGGGS